MLLNLYHKTAKNYIDFILVLDELLNIDIFDTRFEAQVLKDR